MNEKGLFWQILISKYLKMYHKADKCKILNYVTKSMLISQLIISLRYIPKYKNILFQNNKNISSGF